MTADDVTLTEAEVNELTGDDIRYWLENSFMPPDLLVEKVRFWVTTVAARAESAGRRLAEVEAAMLALADEWERTTTRARPAFLVAADELREDLRAALASPPAEVER